MMRTCVLVEAAGCEFRGVRQVGDGHVWGVEVVRSSRTAPTKGTGKPARKSLPFRTITIPTPDASGVVITFPGPCVGA